MANRWLLGTVASLALVGCGSHPVESYADNVRAATEEACECEAFRTTATAAECVAMADLATEAEIQCAKDVYSRNESVSEGPAECAADAANRLKGCIERATCNVVAAQNCLSTFNDEAGLCPDLPSDVLAEVIACGF